MLSHHISRGGDAHTTLIAVAASHGAGDGLSLAQTNGTILAILIAGFLGFLFIVFQSLDRLSSELVEQANRVREFDFTWGIGNSAAYGPDQLDRVFELCTLVTATSLHLPAELVGVKLEPDRAERGRKLLEAISSLGRSYPLRVTEQPLHTEKQVEGWLNDLEAVTTRLAALSGAYDHVSKLAAAADEKFNPPLERFVQHQEEMIAREQDPERRELHEALRGTMLAAQAQMAEVHTIALRDFFTLVARARHLASETRGYLDAIQRYRRRLIPGYWLRAIVVIALAVFVCGVAIPMVRPGVSLIFDAWIPAAIYTFALSYGGLQLIRHYAKRTQ